MAPTDYSNVPTPFHCYVDFCLIPVSSFGIFTEYNASLSLRHTSVSDTDTISSTRLEPATPRSRRKSPKCRSCSKPAACLTRCTRPAQQWVSWSVFFPHDFHPFFPSVLWEYKYQVDDKPLFVTQKTEGNWDEVMKVIGQAHTVVHQKGAVRVQTSMRAGTR
jgi:hypothetical protein